VVALSAGYDLVADKGLIVTFAHEIVGRKLTHVGVAIMLSPEVLIVYRIIPWIFVGYGATLARCKQLAAVATEPGATATPIQIGISHANQHHMDVNLT